MHLGKQYHFEIIDSKKHMHNKTKAVILTLLLVSSVVSTVTLLRIANYITKPEPRVTEVFNLADK